MSKSIQAVFDDLLKTFTTANASSMEAAQALANMAIQQFEEHGDLSFAIKFLGAMHSKYNRVQAFLKWLMAFSPVKVEGSLQSGYILSKDKGEKAVEFNVAEALKVSFWDYDSPKEEIIQYDTEALLKALKGAINKFRGAKYQAHNDMALAALNKADMAVLHLEQEVRADIAAKAVTNTAMAPTSTQEDTPPVDAVAEAMAEPPDDFYEDEDAAVGAVA